MLSKPSTPAATSSGPGEPTKGGKKEKAAAKSQTPDPVKCTVPKFFNVRPVAVMDESQPQPEIDEEVLSAYAWHQTYLFSREMVYSGYVMHVVVSLATFHLDVYVCVNY